MLKTSTDFNFWPCILFMLVLLSCSLIASQGTLDVHTWIRWMQDYLDYGPFAGYAHNKTDYPPLMVFIFYSFTKLLSPLEIGNFFTVKITILTFSLLASLLVFYWTRNYVLTTLFHLSFIINSVCLGYGDIILSCFLILALWQLQKRNIAACSTLFSLAIFIKWQALIISPFLFLYLLSLHKQNRAQQINIILVALLPFLLVTGLVVYCFGFNPLLLAFTWAFHHAWPSGYALNTHWIVTYLYRAFSPDTFGGLTNGEISFISTESTPAAFLFLKMVFIAGFLYVLFSFSQLLRMSFEKLMVYSLAGYLLYFTFNTGVHENHLFLAFVLSLVLSSINASYLSLTITIALAFNINMLFFYGFDGRFNFPRVIASTIDPTLIFALLNTVVFSYAAIRLVSTNKTDSQDLTAAV